LPNPPTAPIQAPSAGRAELNERDPGFATTLARGLALMEAFGPGEERLGNGELAQRTGLSRPTVTRLAQTLAELGYLRHEGNKYQLGTRVLAIAHPLLAGLRVRQLARPLMTSLAEQLHGAVSLGLLDGLDAIYVETSRSADPHPLSPDIGSSIAAARAAIGRALLSMLGDAEVDAFGLRLQRERAEQWRAWWPATRAGIADCRARGYCVSPGDYRSEVHAVGVPLMRTASGRMLAINCGIPAFRLRPGELESEIGPRMVALAASLRALAAGT
jgi:DNA-binding IclR family transcriptional regulator